MHKFNTVAILLVLFCAQAVFADTPSAKVEPGYDAELSNYHYAFNVHFFPIKSQRQALKMAYIYLQGQPGKAVVTLMHGKNFNADYWAETAKFLHAKGYGVLIPDQIGFGKSSKPANYQYSFAALASNTQALLRALKIQKTVVLGHSMGGMLASRFALMFPQHTHQLVLVNPIGLENYLSYVEYKDTDFFYANELKKTAASIKSYQQKFYYDGNWNKRYEALTRFMVGQIKGPDKERIAWVNAQTYDMIFTQPVITEFKNLRVPTRLIIGTRDRTGPGRNWKRPGVTHELGRYDRLGKTAVSLIPDAALFELKGVGHLPHIENFHQFKGLLAQAVTVKALAVKP